MPKALKLREHVPAMANPHKSAERERVGVDKNKISPEGSELKKLGVCARTREWGAVFFNTDEIDF